MKIALKRLLQALSISLFLLFFAYCAYSFQAITGKVISISDGDTITVLQDRTQYKIRLYGIDTPESHQDFGTRAKQFTSDLVFGKQVKVIQQDMDRYGRIVGLVYVGDACLNKEIVRNGFAWVYRKYCNQSFCSGWLKLEEAARAANMGLWSHKDPIPPWEFRRGKKASSGSAESANLPAGTVYHGNTNSKIFHQPGCQHYNCKNCTVIFQSRDEAKKAGYKRCRICKP